MSSEVVDATLAEEAVRIVSGDRNRAYDKPERNFTRIAKVWEGLTDRSFTPHEVALMMVGLKLVREAHKHQRDNIVDGIGYLLTADASLPSEPVPPSSEPEMCPASYISITHGIVKPLHCTLPAHDPEQEWHEFA